MKAQLTLESIGHTAYQKMCGMRKFVKTVGCGDFMGYMPPPCHVAELRGFDHRYGYARVFIKGFTDYSKANSKGSRGVYKTYLIESGRVYEVKEKTSRKNTRIYYCYVCPDSGDVIEMSKDDVDKFLKSLFNA